MLLCISIVILFVITDKWNLRDELLIVSLNLIEAREALAKQYIFFENTVEFDVNDVINLNIWNRKFKKFQLML